MKLPVITVVNTHHTKQGEYIGRGSPLGNPFTHMVGTKAEFIVSSREQAVSSYGVWLDRKIAERDPQIIAELNRLANKALAEGHLELRCYCAPKACHGDVLKKLFLDAIAERES